MEKPTQSSSKTKSNFLKFLPKTSSIYFQNPPFSPNRVKPAAGKGFSGSIIPDEARRRSKSGSTNSFYTQEPTSPKISCMGQIKHKKRSTTKSNNPKPDPDPTRDPGPPAPLTPQVKKPSAIKRFLTGSSKPDHGRRKSDASVYDKQPLSAGRAPALSQMKRFASGRDTLSNFDWSSEFTPGNYSDEEFEGEEEIVIPFPAALAGGPAADLRPRKEVNLWKRRTVDPPKALQLNQR